MAPNHLAGHRTALIAGCWLSVPVLIVAVSIWFLGINGLALNILIAVCALSLPWGLLLGFVFWLTISALANVINLDAFASIYWGICLAAILGAHLNGFLLFAHPGEKPEQGSVAANSSATNSIL